MDEDDTGNSGPLEYGCKRHRGTSLRDYEKLPQLVRDALKYATFGWCATCFLNVYRGSGRRSAIVTAARVVKTDMGRNGGVLALDLTKEAALRRKK